MASTETPPPSIRQGVRIVPPDGSVSVEEVLLAVGEQVGHDKLCYASRMNKAVVVFLKDEAHVHQLIESSVFIRDLFVQVSPLLTALTPPRGLVEDIQRAILEFFWSGKHWVRAAVLYLPVAEGGQGLINIQSKIASFRLRTAQKLLYNCGPGWCDTGRLLLRKAGRLGYDKQLFLLRLGDVDFTGLTSFYSSVLQAWQIFLVARVENETPGMWLFEEPLFFNNFIRAQTLLSASLRVSLREAGCTKLGHLIRMTAGSVDTLRERSNITSKRLISRVVEEVCAALTPSHRAFVKSTALCDQWSEGGEYSFPSLSITPAVGEWQEGGGQLLSFSTPHLDKFQDAGKKEVYQSCVKVLNLRSLAGTNESRWAGFFGPDISPKGSWRSLYKLPVEKRAADLQWRIVHGAIATNRYRAHMDPELGEGCVFCSQAETLEHLFVCCPRLEVLFDLLKKWFQGLGESFSFDLFIFGPKYCAKTKLAIWLTRRNRTQGDGSVQLVPVLEGLLKARLRVEYSYYHMMDKTQAFSRIWAVGGVLCSVGEHGELIVNF
ncbi:putative 149 kDa protein ORF 2 [Collichthys lucidus]|uniref:Putative 149 kDa protein ORF 2 n=1 Tax=Collichthys lucidus TaxID=240159 RepID=A0A4U5TXX7_COLLU|nr:putative 149 kDa protein ORF 2 [Collichthys lucidus]